jgi:glycosyltransferase involved in cell wall biosynthesis
MTTTPSPKSPPKIGILTCELAHTHGWAHYSLSLIQALRRAGIEMTIITVRNSPPIDGLDMVPLLPNVNPRENHLLLKMALQSVTVRHLLRDCDIIHAAIEPFAPLAAWVAGARPLMITGHGSYMYLAKRRRWPVSALYRRAFERAHIVCVSRYTESVVHTVLPAARTTVINNGVDVERFQASKPTAQPSTLRTILSVGAVKPRKGTLELVQAMAAVRQQRPDVQCIIIGSLTQELGYVERVQAAVRDLHLEDCVHLLGHLPNADLLDWYQKADVFVLPSMNDGWKFEGYGIVYLEASAAGLPVIGTTNNGAEDAIDDGLTGLLVPQEQVAGKLPEAILRLLNNPSLVAQMGAAGRAKALWQTWDTVAMQMVELYNQVGG